MRITERGINFIKYFEGFRSHIYYDLAGRRTIGYGHMLKENEDIETVTETEAEELLIMDLLKVEKSILRLIYVPLEDYQFDALASFTYNLGAGALQRSTLRQKLNRGEYESVPREMKRWVWAGGRKIKGLMIRREAEALLFQNKL